MDYLTLAEAAAQLGRNTELVRTWVASGRLVGRKRANRWFIRPSDLVRFQRRAPVRRTWSTDARQSNRRRARKRTAS